MTLQRPPGAPVVTVADGRFAGFEGIDQGKGSVQVLLTCFGREITIKVDVGKA